MEIDWGPTKYTCHQCKVPCEVDWGAHLQCQKYSQPIQGPGLWEDRTSILLQNTLVEVLLCSVSQLQSRERSFINQ